MRCVNKKTLQKLQKRTIDAVIKSAEFDINIEEIHNTKSRNDKINVNCVRCGKHRMVYVCDIIRTIKTKCTICRVRDERLEQVKINSTNSQLEYVEVEGRRLSYNCSIHGAVEQDYHKHIICNYSCSKCKGHKLTAKERLADLSFSRDRYEFINLTPGKIEVINKKCNHQYNVKYTYFMTDNCPVCNKNLRLLWKKDPTDSCIIYFVKVNRVGEEFYKIGVTTLDVEERFKRKSYNDCIITTLFKHTSTI